MSPETAGIILLLVTLIAVFIYLFSQKAIQLWSHLKKQGNEGFENSNTDEEGGSSNAEGRVIDDPSKFYDDFYVSRIDQAYYPEGKNICRCSDLYKTAFRRLYPKKDTKVLLAGANTGRYLDALTGVCPDTTGVVKYEGLFEIAKRNAPKAKVVLGDIAETPDIFPDNEFSHIIFEDRTLYEVDRKKALTNAIKWLRPGGRLVLRVVNRDKFDPMVPTAVPLRGLNVQNYLAQRKQDSKVFFKDGSKIETNYTPIPSEDRAIFREDLFTSSGSLLRTQIHRWSVPQSDVIFEEVTGLGLQHDQSVKLAPCTSPHETYEIFIKPLVTSGNKE